MTRFLSQIVFVSPHEIMRRTVVEQNEKNTITRIFSFDEGITESAHTLFFDGIISSEIISIKKNQTGAVNVHLCSDYQYIDLSEIISDEPIYPTGKNLILDFGTDKVDEINKKIVVMASCLQYFSIFDIIASVTYYPAILMGKSTFVQEGNTTGLLLWRNIDFSNNRLTENTQIRFLSSCQLSE